MFQTGNFPWQMPPLYDTPPYCANDIMWHHWCDVALPPLHSWILILWLYFFFCIGKSNKIHKRIDTRQCVWVREFYFLHRLMSWNVLLKFKNSLNNFICHLSWLEKISPTHTHSLISICEFLKPYKLLYFELESLIKCWMWIGKKCTQ